MREENIAIWTASLSSNWDTYNILGCQRVSVLLNCLIWVDSYTSSQVSTNQLSSDGSYFRDVHTAQFSLSIAVLSCSSQSLPTKRMNTCYNEACCLLCCDALFEEPTLPLTDLDQPGCEVNCIPCSLSYSFCSKGVDLSGTLGALFCKSDGSLICRGAIHICPT